MGEIQDKIISLKKIYDLAGLQNKIAQMLIFYSHILTLYINDLGLLLTPVAINMCTSKNRNYNERITSDLLRRPMSCFPRPSCVTGTDCLVWLVIFLANFV